MNVRSAAPAEKLLSVLVLDPVGEDGWGGVETWLLDVSRGLAARGHRVAAAGVPGGAWTKRAAEAGFPTCDVPLRSDFAPGQTRTLARFMRAHAVEVVATKLHRGIRAAGFAARFAGGPPVVAFMGLVETKPGAKYRWTYRLFLDAVVTLTEPMRAEIAARGGLDPSGVHVVPYGIRAADFDVPPGTREAARAELGVAADAPVAVAVGRLHEQKRYDVMLDAWGRVAADAPTARLLIAGTGSLAREVLADVERHFISGSVQMLGFRSDLPRLLAAADALVMSSDDEGVPIVALAAMAAGRPVVGTRVGSMAAAVESGVTGVLVEKGDPAALAAALRSVLLAPDRGAAMGAAGRARVLVRFSHERCIDETERLFLAVRRRRA